MRRNQIIASIGAAVMALAVWVPSSPAEVGLTISIGDRPFYEGPSYWDAGYEWVWVPGYDRGHHWVHGHYEKRGSFHREHAREHHHKRHHDKRDR